MRDSGPPSAAVTGVGSRRGRCQDSGEQGPRQVLRPDAQTPAEISGEVRKSPRKWVEKTEPGWACSAAGGEPGAARRNLGRGGALGPHVLSPPG